MKKATSKILNFAFLGLLSFAASLFYSPNVFAEVEVQKIKAQSVWDYMKEALSEGGFGSFKQNFGENYSAESYFVLCGKYPCNLEHNSCMSKKDKKEKKYSCVSEVLKEQYIKEGWKIQEEKKDIKSKDDICYEAKALSETTEGKKLVKKYCVRVTNGEAVVIAQSENKKGKSRDACEVIPVRLFNDSECRFCSMIGIIYAVADEITVLSYEKLGFSFSIVIILGLMLWIAVKTLAFTSSMTKQDAAKYITEILKQSFKFALSYFALVYFQDVFSLIILPLLNAGIGFGNTLLNGTTIESRFDPAITSDIIKALSKNDNAALHGFGDALPLDYRGNIDNKYFKIHIYALIENFAYNVNLNYAMLQSLGGALWCMAFEFMSLQHGYSTYGIRLIPLGWACAIYGIAFGTFGFLLSIAFIFYLLDAIVQLGIVGALLPFLIVSWPFKITSKYTSTGFKMLLNSVFTFMIMGVVVRINIGLIESAMKLGDMGDIHSFANAIDQINISVIDKRVSVININFLLFLFANILGFLMLGKISALVNRFASGGIKPIASDIGGMAASAVSGVIKKVAAPTVNAVGDWASNKMTKGAKAIGGTVESIAKGGVKIVWAVGTLKPARKAATRAFLKTKAGQKVQGFANMFKDSPTEDDKKIKEENLKKSQDILGAKKEQTATVGDESKNPIPTIGVDTSSPSNDIETKPKTAEDRPKSGTSPTKENLNELD